MTLLTRSDSETALLDSPSVHSNAGSRIGSPPYSLSSDRLASIGRSDDDLRDSPSLNQSTDSMQRRMSESSTPGVPIAGSPVSHTLAQSWPNAIPTPMRRADHPERASIRLDPVHSPLRNQRIGASPAVDKIPEDNDTTIV